MSDNEEVEAELLPDLRDSTVLALIAASLIGKRAIVNGEASQLGMNDFVFSIETVNDEEVEIVYDDGRRVRLDGEHVKSLRIEWEPADRPGSGLLG